MDNEFNVTLKNLDVKEGMKIEELTIKASFKCEPEIAEKMVSVFAELITKLS